MQQQIAIYFSPLFQVLRHPGREMFEVLLCHLLPTVLVVVVVLPVQIVIYDTAYYLYRPLFLATTVPAAVMYRIAAAAWPVVAQNTTAVFVSVLAHNRL